MPPTSAGVPIFENTGSNRLESGHGVPYRDGGRGYAPLYGAALCGGGLMGAQAGQRVLRRAYAPTPIFEYVARYLNVK